MWLVDTESIIWPLYVLLFICPYSQLMMVWQQAAANILLWIQFECDRGHQSSIWPCCSYLLTKHYFWSTFWSFIPPLHVKKYFWSAMLLHSNTYTPFMVWHNLWRFRAVWSICNINSSFPLPIKSWSCSTGSKLEWWLGGINKQCQVRNVQGILIPQVTWGIYVIKWKCLIFILYVLKCLPIFYINCQIYLYTI